MSLTPLDYKRALDSQSACNAGGLIHSLMEVLPRIQAEANGTREVNQHPIIRMYVEQLMFLAGGDYTYSRSYEICQTKGKENG